MAPKIFPPQKNGGEKFMVIHPMGSQDFVVESLNKQKESKSWMRSPWFQLSLSEKNLVYFGLQLLIV